MKMGWQRIGRVRVSARPRRPASVATMLRARVPAERWSLPTSAGVPAADVLQDRVQVDELLASQPSTGGTTTSRTTTFLRWRYAGCAPVAYRASLMDRDPAGGFVLFRLRRRGRATEAVIGDVIGRGDAQATRRAMTSILRETTADYLVQLGRGQLRSGFLPVIGSGPILTQRRLGASAPIPLHEWELGMGDIELF